MELEQIFVLGVDQRTPIGIREKVTIDKRLEEVAWEAKTRLGADEIVILSTCHRSEIYILAKRAKEEDFIEFFCKLFPVDEEMLLPYVFLKRGYDAINHIFRVAAGLESMVVGEDQILGQVKDALDMSQGMGASGKILNRLFLEAITLGKDSRASTGISENSLSISYIAVLFVLDVFEDLKDKAAYVIGAGEMGRLAIQHLLAKGMRDVMVSNRTHHRAMELKREIPQVTVVPYEEKYERMVSCDILISATDAPHYTVGFDRFKDVFKKDRICIVDIALPRDVDPLIAEIPGVNLYTLDDLKRTADDNLERRKNLISVIEMMVKEGVEKYIRWIQGLCIVPAIKAMKGYADNVCAAEFDFLADKIPAVDDGDKAKIKQAMDRVAKKMIKNYLLDLKDLAEAGKLDHNVLHVFQGGGSRE